MGDSVDSVVLVSAGAVNTANVDTYDIDGSDAEGTGLDNYTITFVDGTMTVTPLTLSIDIDDQEKTYGDEDPNLTFLTSALANDDTLGDIFDSFANRDNDPGEDVGDYIIDGVPNIVNTNYQIGEVTDGTLTIIPATVTVTADPQSKLFGELDPELTFDVSGLKFDDTFEEIFNDGELDRDPGEEVDSYAINQNTLDLDGESQNYILEYIGNFLTIRALPVEPDLVAEAPLFDDEPLGRPIVSYANQVIVLNEPFEAVETVVVDTNVDISTSAPTALTALEPAAGTGVEGIEPAAGGEVGEQTGDTVCGNAFLQNDLPGKEACGITDPRTPTP